MPTITVPIKQALQYRDAIRRSPSPPPLEIVVDRDPGPWLVASITVLPG